MSDQPIVDTDFDRRWVAWQERGWAHDRLLLARLRIALPTVALFVAVGGYLLLIR